MAEGTQTGTTGTETGTKVDTGTQTQTGSTQTGFKSDGSVGTQQTGKTETAASTTLAGGKADDLTLQAQAKWPDDWRKQIAGDDAKVLERLGRMQSPAEIWKSYTSLEKRLSAGELTAKLPENATPEQVAEYRKTAGVPEKAEAYVEALKLPEGMVAGEADKPLLASFAERALSKNWTPGQYNDAVSWYFEQQEQLQAQRAEQDEVYKTESQIELTQEWGPQFKQNLNAMGNLISLLPEGVGDRLLGGRTADGKLIGNDPGVLRGLVHLALQLNPAATLLPAGTSDGAKGVDDQIKEIEGWMKSPQGSEGWTNYWKSAETQDRYRGLLGARETMKSRAA